MECSILSDEYDSVLFNACTIQENIMSNESLNFSLHESANIFQVPPIPTPKQSITKETRFLICEARSRGSLISDICRNFDVDRSLVIRILHHNLILPVESNSYMFASSENY